MHARQTWGRLGAGLLALLAAATAGLAAQDAPAPPPPLPTLTPEAYPEAARADIGAAYAQAAAAPNDVERVGALAILLHAWSELEPAAQAYARAQALAPREPSWWYLGGLAADRRVRPADAARQFEEARTLLPDQPLVTLRLADARLAAGDSDAATVLYRALTAEPATAPAAWYGLARIHLERGDDAEARAALQQAIDIYPEFGAAHYAMAQVQRRAGDAAAARVSLARQQQCLACWPMPPDPWRDRIDAARDDATALLTRGLASARAGAAAADAEAIRLHEEVLAKDPSLAQVHVNLVELYGRTGNLAKAEQHYRTASAAPGFAPDAHRAYAMVLLSQQKPAEALVLFEQAAAIVPGDPAAQYGIGVASEMLNRPDAAVDAYTRALRAAPTMRTARFGLARALMGQRNTDEAIVQLEQLRQPEDAESARYRFALSVAYVRAGQLAVGKKTAAEALELARRFGDTALAATIDTELRKLP